MFIIDFSDRTIGKFTNLEMCLFINKMIDERDPDLYGKRYLFVPDKKCATAIITSMMENEKLIGSIQ
jgi:hypothetical protein